RVGQQVPPSAGEAREVVRQRRGGKDEGENDQGTPRRGNVPIRQQQCDGQDQQQEVVRAGERRGGQRGGGHDGPAPREGDRRAGRGDGQQHDGRGQRGGERARERGPL